MSGSEKPVPLLDLGKNWLLSGLKFQAAATASVPTGELEVTVRSLDTGEVARILIGQPQEIRIVEFGVNRGILLQLCKIDISGRGMEHVRYEVVDILDKTLSCFADSVEVVVEPIPKPVQPLP